MPNNFIHDLLSFYLFPFFQHPKLNNKIFQPMYLGVYLYIVEPSQTTFIVSTYIIYNCHLTQLLSYNYWVFNPLESYLSSILQYIYFRHSPLINMTHFSTHNFTSSKIDFIGVQQNLPFNYQATTLGIHLNNVYVN